MALRRLGLTTPAGDGLASGPRIGGGITQDFELALDLFLSSECHPSPGPLLPSGLFTETVGVTAIDPKCRRISHGEEAGLLHIVQDGRVERVHVRSSDETEGDGDLFA